MTALPLDEEHGGGRFPDLDILAQSSRWDDTTRTVVEARLTTDRELRFFSRQEARIASALLDQLLFQREEPKVPVLEMIDHRLADDETDGWRYDSMPFDPEAWRRSLEALDADSVERHGTAFADLGWEDQTALVGDVQHVGDGTWHSLSGTAVWSLWTRYACTAFYSHPWAWQEMGFSGPAYPRGYLNLGVDKREHFEVPDRHPYVNPQRGDDS